MSDAHRLKIKLQIYCGPEIAFGPGKADLLEAIMAQGSISGAGRAMGMSYRRAWLLVDAMNRCFSGPLVEARPGGAVSGGAAVTELGQAVLAHYRALQEAVANSAGADWAWLDAALLPSPKAHQKD